MARIWVNTDYLNEYAVLTTWLSTLLPWTISTGVIPNFGQFARIYFPLASIRYLWVNPFDHTTIKTPLGAYHTQAGHTMATIHLLWLLGTTLLILTLALSITLYYNESRTTRHLPYPPAHLLGIGLALTASCFTLATAAHHWYNFPGTAIPLSQPFLFLFAYTILTTTPPSR